MTYFVDTYASTPNSYERQEVALKYLNTLTRDLTEVQWSALGNSSFMLLDKNVEMLQSVHKTLRDDGIPATLIPQGDPNAGGNSYPCEPHLEVSARLLQHFFDYHQCAKHSRG